jgi:glycosyltransferase involved in cell wall biosynthesis
MARIAVFHPHLMAGGGGEAVCMNVLQALEDRHDVTLVTITDPDIGRLDDYYDTDVGTVDVDRGGWTGPAITKLSDGLSIPDGSLWKIRASLFKRACDLDAYDLVVSTYNEFAFRPPAVQYVHYPTGAGHGRGATERAYLRLVEMVGGYDRDRVGRSTLLANSEWTATSVESRYGVRPRVVYPPVDVSALRAASRPWESREHGFVAVGRLSPEKNVERSIRIVSALRSRGRDVHLHIVGPGGETEYGTRIRRRADATDGIHFEGELPRQELLDLLGSHRYGLHGMRAEHFGMVVAEFAAAGALPFVHDSGGQVEIVDGREELCYGGTADAVERIEGLLENPERQREIGRQLSTEVERFGRERFRAEIRGVVSTALAGID